MHILTFSWKMCITTTSITSVKTKSRRMTKNCRPEKSSWKAACSSLPLSVTSILLAIKYKHTLTEKYKEYLKHSLSFEPLTMNNRQRCSLSAPRQPKNPVTMVMPPATSSRLAAERDGKESGREENSACVKDSQTPTPNKPHPPSLSEKKKKKVPSIGVKMQRWPKGISLKNIRVGNPKLRENGNNITLSTTLPLRNTELEDTAGRMQKEWIHIWLNTNPEDEVEDKHQIFDTAQTPRRHWHPAKERQNRSKRLHYLKETRCAF